MVTFVLLLNTISGSSYCSVNRAITTLDEHAALQAGACANYTGTIIITGVKGMVTLDFSVFSVIQVPVNITVAANPDLQELPFSALSGCSLPEFVTLSSYCVVNIWNNPSLGTVSLPLFCDGYGSLDVFSSRIFSQLDPAGASLFLGRVWTAWSF